MVTKLVPSSGKSSLTSTVLTPPEPITETLTSNWKESMYITMKLLVEDTYLEPSLWTWNQEPWIQLELDHSDNSLDQITSSSDNPEPETTGLRDITLKELNSLTQSSMSLERKLKVVIASKVSKSPTLSEVVPDQVWEPS